MIQVIINADDLGINKQMNGSIKHYASKGLISSASILANGPAFYEGIDVAKNNPHLSFGVHLNLTEFQSLTRPNIFYESGFIDDQGEFVTSEKREEVIMSNHLKDAIYVEWKNQIEQILDFNIALSHINGHHHIHTNNELFGLTIKLVNKYKIKSLRIKNRKPLSFYLPKPKRSAQVTYGGDSTNNKPNNIRSKKQIRKLQTLISNEVWYRKISCLPYLTTTNYFLTYLDLCRFLSCGHSLPKKCSVELMTHPGGEGCDWFHLENELLEKKELSRLLPKYKLITFNDLLTN